MTTLVEGHEIVVRIDRKTAQRMDPGDEPLRFAFFEGLAIEVDGQPFRVKAINRAVESGGNLDFRYTLVAAPDA